VPTSVPLLSPFWSSTVREIHNRSNLLLILASLSRISPADLVMSLGHTLCCYDYFTVCISAGLLPNPFSVSGRYLLLPGCEMFLASLKLQWISSPQTPSLAISGNTLGSFPAILFLFCPPGRNLRKFHDVLSAKIYAPLLIMPSHSSGGPFDPRWFLICFSPRPLFFSAVFSLFPSSVYK